MNKRDRGSWQSARRLRLHVIGPVLLLLIAGCVLLAAAQIDDPGSRHTWGDFGLGFLAAFLLSLPLYIYSTLKGPMFVADSAKRHMMQSRNVRWGLTVFGVGYALTVGFLRERFASGALPTGLGAFAGFLLGVFLGIGGVWLYHHLRGTWPPDADP